MIMSYEWLTRLICVCVGVCEGYDKRYMKEKKINIKNENLNGNELLVDRKKNEQLKHNKTYRAT